MRSRRLLLLLAVLCGGLPLALALSAGPAQAQVALNTQTFHPAIGPDSMITVEGSRTPGFLKPMADVLFEFAYQPLRLTDPTTGKSEGNPVDTMTTAHLMAGLGLTRWLALSFDLPLVLYQTSSGSVPTTLIPTTASVFGLGDFRLVAKARILDNQNGGLGLAFVPQFTFPTGSGTSFRGYSVPSTNVYTIEPRVALDYRFSRGVLVALNAGFQGRVCSGLGGSFSSDPTNASHACDQIVQSDRVSHLVTYGLGASTPLPKGFSLAADVIGATSVAKTDVGSLYSPLAGYLAARWTHRSGFTVHLGGGGTFLSAIGEPYFRVFAGVGYLPLGKKEPARQALDSDGDGIPDEADACPQQAGVASDDPKKNGCPIGDQDGDGVADASDQCPTVPAGPHPDPKRSGCPIGDQDSDGVFDDVDQCPTVPAGDHPDPNKPGCPIGDKDGDGVFDDVDQCPEVVAGPHPDPNKPGCPDLDSDGDGVFDGADQCPKEPAGINPDPKRPGCPLPDRDHDMVPDAADACPDKPGAPSPDPKKNGCPGIVEVKGGRIVIHEEIFFANNKDVIQKKSFKVVQAVADTLQVIPAIKRVLIEGHTDNKGTREKNLALSERRAQAVRRWLVEHNVAPERLEAKGFGPDHPIADNATAAGRGKNRRVDFNIVDPPQPAGADAAPAQDAGVVPAQDAAQAKTKGAKKAKAKGKKKGG